MAMTEIGHAMPHFDSADKDSTPNFDRG